MAERKRFTGLSRDGTKLVAVLAMALNHFQHGFLEPGTWAALACEAIGYFTAPAMCWFLASGFRTTRSRRKYFARLCGTAVLSQVPYMLYFGPPWRMNMLMTLTLCFLILAVRHSGWPGWAKLPAQAALVAATAWCDWPVMAALFVIGFDLAIGRDSGYNTAWMAACGMFAVFCTMVDPECYAGIPSGTYVAACSAGPVLAWLCVAKCMDPDKPRRGGAIGRIAGPAFYLFYPAHLALLCMCAAAMGR